MSNLKRLHETLLCLRELFITWLRSSTALSRNVAKTYQCWHDCQIWWCAPGNWSSPPTRRTRSITWTTPVACCAISSSGPPLWVSLHLLMGFQDCFVSHHCHSTQPTPADHPVALRVLTATWTCTWNRRFLWSASFLQGAKPKKKNSSEFEKIPLFALWSKTRSVSANLVFRCSGRKRSWHAVLCGLRSLFGVDVTSEDRRG